LDKFLDEKSMAIALKFVKSPFLEKRVKGVTEIKELAEKVEGVKRRSISKSDLVKFIKDNLIIEGMLLGDSVHSELVKRSADIVVFLARCQAFPAEMIDKIWEQNQGKHETTIIAVIELFKQLSPFMSIDLHCLSFIALEMVDRFYPHLQAIPLG
jgi:ubiquitin carboxyl-terminal hydrolase 9/24